jgi:hypothetical protein
MSVVVLTMVVGRSRSPLWTQYEGRDATSVSVIGGVAGQSRRPFWAQQEGRSATSVSVIVVVLAEVEVRSGLNKRAEARRRSRSS